MSPLTVIFVLPLLAALVMALIPRTYRTLFHLAAWLASLVSMLVAIYAFCNFGRQPEHSGFRYVEQHAWAPAAGISYHVGADGLNLGLTF